MHDMLSNNQLSIARRPGALGQGCPEHAAYLSNWGACIAHSAESHSQVIVHQAKGPPIYCLLRNALEFSTCMRPPERSKLIVIHNMAHAILLG